MKRLAPFAILFAATLSQAADVSVNVTLNPAGSFVAKTSGVKWDIKKNGDQFTAKNVAVPLNGLKTGIALRDQHMQNKYLETGKFPNAVMVDATGKDGEFTGNFQLHGVTKPVSGTYEIKGKKGVAKFKVNTSDFGIAPASYMGVGVEEEIEIEVTGDVL